MKKRPVFITIIAILSVISGISILIIQFASNFGSRLNGIYSQFELTAIVLVFSFLALVYIISGIGILLRKKWGWFFGGYMYAFNICRYIIGVVSAYVLYPEIAKSSKVTEVVGRVIISSLVLMYFFSDGILEYFDLDITKKRYYLIRVIAAAVLTIVVRDIGGIILKNVFF